MKNLYNELYYLIYINEFIIKKYRYNKYKENKTILKNYINSYKFNNQIIAINNKKITLRKFLDICIKKIENISICNKDGLIDLNSCTYVNKIYLRDQINYIDYNFKLTKKQILKNCNELNYYLNIL